MLHQVDLPVEGCYSRKFGEKNKYKISIVKVIVSDLKLIFHLSSVPLVPFSVKVHFGFCSLEKKI